MDVSVSRLSSKGQIVLAKEARLESKAKEGDEFIVISEGSRIELFRLSDEPKKLLLKELSALASRGQALSRKIGLKSEKEVIALALKRR